MPASTSTSDDQTTRLEPDADPGPDISLLKEIGRKALIDALNSVRRPYLSMYRGLSIFIGQWCQNSRPRSLYCRTTGIGHGCIIAQGQTSSYVKELPDVD